MESNSWGIYEAFGPLALAHHWALPFRQRCVRFRPNCFRQVCFHPAPDRRLPLGRRPHCTSSCLWQHKCQTRGCCWWCFALLLLLKACLNPTSPGHIKHGKKMSWRRFTSKTTFTWFLRPYWKREKHAVRENRMGLWHCIFSPYLGKWHRSTTLESRDSLAHKWEWGAEAKYERTAGSTR